ncbi:MAG: hypothetical protein RL375_1102 [Pseudomonadota bacterium]|jgi:hypothetical protein
MTAYGRAYTQINGTDIKSCRSRGVDRRIRPFSGGFDGTLHQTMHSGIRTAPQSQLSTADLGALLGVLTNAETPMVALNGSTGLKMVWPKANSAAPGDAAGSVHRSEIMASGAVYLDGISWSAGDIAEATATAFGINAAGTTDPVATSQVSAALPAVYPTVAYVLTAFTVNGVSITDLARFDLRLAHGAKNDDEAACYLHGKPHPTTVLHPGAGGQIAMELSFETGDLGATIALGNIVATFTPLNPGDIGTSGTAKTLTMVPGMLIETGPTDGTPSRRSYRALLKHDGTNRPLTVS